MPRRWRPLHEAIEKARPVLLEPIMTIAITVPDEYMGDITGGKGSFELTFARYEQVASNIAQKIIAAAQKDKVADED